MGIRILLVDDSIEILETVSYCLEEEGYEVLTASNGIEALQIMELSPVALVVTDIMMPQMGGLEFVEKCRKNSSFGHVPIIIVSSKYNESTKAIASEMGVNGFLEKPINFELLQKAISLTLAKSAEVVRQNLENEQIWKERRQYQRAPFLCEASFSSENISGITLLSSLSLGGCSLDTKIPINKGTVLTLTIKLDPNHTIRVEGKVCYSIPRSGIGIQFMSLDNESKQLIENIVNSVCSIKNIYEFEHQNKFEKMVDSIDKSLAEKGETL
jgi:DNA-binding response OmpR family regulator